MSTHRAAAGSPAALSGDTDPLSGIFCVMQLIEALADVPSGGALKGGGSGRHLQVVTRDNVKVGRRREDGTLTMCDACLANKYLIVLNTISKH